MRSPSGAPSARAAILAAVPDSSLPIRPGSVLVGRPGSAAEALRERVERLDELLLGLRRPRVHRRGEPEVLVVRNRTSRVGDGEEAVTVVAACVGRGPEGAPGGRPS